VGTAMDICAVDAARCCCGSYRRRCQPGVVITASLLCAPPFPARAVSLFGSQAAAREASRSALVAHVAKQRSLLALLDHYLAVPPSLSVKCSQQSRGSMMISCNYRPLRSAFLCFPVLSCSFLRSHRAPTVRASLCGLGDARWRRDAPARPPRGAAAAAGALRHGSIGARA